MKPATFLRDLARRVAGVVVLVPVSLASAAPVTPLTYSTSVDIAAQTATFQVKFDHTPDLLTVDAYFRQADCFQFWVDAVAPDPMERAYAGLSGTLPADTQTVISTREIPRTGALEIIWIAPLDAPGARDRGGWGSVAGSTPYSLATDNTVAFTLPLSLLRDTDGDFYYSLATFAYGAQGYPVYSGVSGCAYPVPVPGALLLGTFGVGLAGWRRRCMTRR
jgi:hypothetical protein